jgi:peptidoglycan/xylan/chitin deacetylase (PgdA/CDA1 family)
VNLSKFQFFDRRGSLTVFTFHRVLAKRHPLYPEWPTTEEFHRKVRWIKGCTTLVSLGDGLDEIRSGKSRRHLSAITFDDGYRDNFEYALPVLMAEKAHATFFIATGYLDRGVLFDDLVTQAIVQTELKSFAFEPMNLANCSIETIAEKRNLSDWFLEKLKYMQPARRDELAIEIAVRLGFDMPTSSMLSKADLLEMHRAGMTIGSHSHNHVIPTTVTNAEFVSDAQKSIELLTAILGERPKLFAFPNGIIGTDFSPDHARQLEEMGFDAGLSTSSGIVRGDTNFFSLPRITPWPRSKLRFTINVIANRYRRE